MLDTTLVSALHCDGSAKRGASHNEQFSWLSVARSTETLNLLVVEAGARLVVLAIEVGGKWSSTQRFIYNLAHARAREEGWILRRRAEQAWRLRWGSLLASTAARVVADSLLELPSVFGADGDVPPSHEVERDFVFAGLAS